MPEKKFHILEVDLTGERIERVDVTRDVESFLGGRSLGAKMLWDHVPASADPMGTENALYIGIGPITGLMGSVTNVSTKSPLTFLRGQSNVNGHFGVELTYTPFNAGILVKGKAKRPVCLVVHDDRVDIQDAAPVWGKSGVETQQALQRQLKEETGEPDFRFMSIGPAGENLVRNADICHDFYHHAARLGVGTVMGSKNLKAIAVKGTQDPGYVRPADIFAMIQTVYRETRTYRMVHRRWGHTTSMAQRYYKTREGVKNKQLGWDPVCDAYNPVQLEQEYKVWSDSCHGCFVGCKVPYFHRHTEVGPCAGELRHDNAGGWAANAMIPGYDLQSYLSAYVDYLGLDSEDVSAVVTWMMECYEKGVVSREDLDGIDLTWGNVKSICALLKKIAYREGIGDLLADGLKIAPEKLGRNSSRYAMTHKGTAISSYELRGSLREALDLAVSPVGELHGGRGTPLRVAYDSLTTCSFLRRELARIFGGVDGWAVPMLNAACGWDITADSWEKTMLRAATMERCYAIREGYRPERDDRLPDRFFDEITHDKYGAPKVLDRNEFFEGRKQRYREYGLKDDGMPSLELLKRLDLDFTIDELKHAIDG